MSNTSFDSLYKKATGPAKTTPPEKPIAWRQPKYDYSLNDINDVYRNGD